MAVSALSSAAEPSSCSAYSTGGVGPLGMIMGFLFFISAPPLGLPPKELAGGGGRTTDGKGPSVGFRPPPPMGLDAVDSLVKGEMELLYLLSREPRSPEITGRLGSSTGDGGGCWCRGGGDADIAPPPPPADTGLGWTPPPPPPPPPPVVPLVLVFFTTRALLPPPAPLPIGGGSGAAALGIMALPCRAALCCCTMVGGAGAVVPKGEIELA
mmetsp:Transcript_13758/g.39499  ORF Transcript_13758/g.39499 Transcript_13758/m.39499 type:complete len:212 (-) Transcript_13758:1336-1971(-)